MMYVVGTPRGSDNPVIMACASATFMKTRHMIEIRTPGGETCYDFVIGQTAADAQPVFDALLGAITQGERVFRIN